jgi:very-short-patch-repair endonuclease
VTIDSYNVDFLIDNKFIIECYGDFWHCNPNRYKPTYYNKGKKKTAQEIWARDEARRQHLISLGYQFLHIWGSDIKDRPKYVRTKVRKFLRGKLHDNRNHSK